VVAVSFNVIYRAIVKDERSKMKKAIVSELGG